MGSESWPRLPVVSKRHQPRYDAYLGFEEIDCGSDEEAMPNLMLPPVAEYRCPFCSEDFDVVGLCCHIDSDHPIEAKLGVCPVCQVRFGADMVAHIIVEHENYFKIQRKRRSRNGSLGTHAISLFKKELREGNVQSHLGSSSYIAALSNPLPDPLLSSFINLCMDDSSKDAEPLSLDERNMANRISDEKFVESIEPSLSKKDQKERARRSAFMQELLLSTIFDTL